MKLFDTHAHLTDDRLMDNLDKVLNRAHLAGIADIITVGTDIEDSQKAKIIAENHQNVRFSAGIHPHEAAKYDKSLLNELSQLATNDNLVALGEMGLDYYYDFSPQTQQQEIFEMQLDLAHKLNRPAIIHCRDSFDDTLAIIKNAGNPDTGIVFHCFSGNKPQAKILLDLGCFLSFTGTITFKNALDTQQAAQFAPLNRIMLETDCPYLSPAPKRNTKPNEPALLIHTAAKLAELKNLPVSEIAQATCQNSRSFFYGQS